MYLLLILNTMDRFDATYSRPDVLLLCARIASSVIVKQSSMSGSVFFGYSVFHYNYNYMCLLHDGQDHALFPIVPGCLLKAQRFNNDVYLHCCTCCCS
jgi:hypothetical protein